MAFRCRRMSNFFPTKKHLREILLHYFVCNRTAADAYRILKATYGKHAPTDRTCRTWFDRFRSGNYNIADRDRPGQMKKFEDDELKALLMENPAQTLKELAKSLNVGESTVSRRLKSIGMIQKRGNWLSLKEVYK